MPKSRDSTSAANIGARVKRARLKAKLSQRGLSALSGLDVVVISRLERGKHTPTVGTLTRLSEALDVPLSTFLQS